MSKKNRLHKKAKKFVKHIDDLNKEFPYGPFKSRDLAAVSSTIKRPLGNDKYDTLLTQCTEWDNGEGYDFTFDSKDGQRFISLHLDDIESILFCLNELKFF